MMNNLSVTNKPFHSDKAMKSYYMLNIVRINDNCYAKNRLHRRSVVDGDNGHISIKWHHSKRHYLVFWSIILPDYRCPRTNIPPRSFFCPSLIAFPYRLRPVRVRPVLPSLGHHGNERQTLQRRPAKGLF
ncbi:hypothetical protein CDAR_525941 [Caerostris darwini]|uniref:Uncharacterized protein n=1 Tax=Caerostris darwini TaxID=1538125 RepID=A0AAV4S682_9ARAC|nr:hypothetical protein CDAR_525941 [Caerostris darwini]